ncbi:MAG: hypothetical protein IH897_11190 [Planctomycetes bacterium]|nr:hypothetical protein [Planctomycetota bacterium]
MVQPPLDAPLLDPEIAVLKLNFVVLVAWLKILPLIPTKPADDPAASVDQRRTAIHHDLAQVAAQWRQPRRSATAVSSSLDSVAATGRQKLSVQSESGLKSRPIRKSNNLVIELIAADSDIRNRSACRGWCAIARCKIGDPRKQPAGLCRPNADLQNWMLSLPGMAGRCHKISVGRDCD